MSKEYTVVSLPRNHMWQMYFVRRLHETFGCEACLNEHYPQALILSGQVNHDEVRDVCMSLPVTVTTVAGRYNSELPFTPPN